MELTNLNKAGSECPQKIGNMCLLNDSVAQLSYRPSYDLLWNSLVAETVREVKQLEENQNPSLPMAMSLWRLTEHLREELCVVRTALNRTLAFVADLKEHEDMVRRQKLERMKRGVEKMQLKKLARETLPEEPAA